MFRVKDSWEKTPDFSHKPGKIPVFLLSFRPFFVWLKILRHFLTASCKRVAAELLSRPLISVNIGTYEWKDSRRLFKISAVSRCKSEAVVLAGPLPPSHSGRGTGSRSKRLAKGLSTPNAAALGS